MDFDTLITYLVLFFFFVLPSLLKRMGKGKRRRPAKQKIRPRLLKKIKSPVSLTAWAKPSAKLSRSWKSRPWKPKESSSRSRADHRGNRAAALSGRCLKTGMRNLRNGRPGRWKRMTRTRGCRKMRRLWRARGRHLISGPGFRIVLLMLLVKQSPKQGQRSKRQNYIPEMPPVDSLCGRLCRNMRFSRLWYGRRFLASLKGFGINFCILTQPVGFYPTG